MSDESSKRQESKDSRLKKPQENEENEENDQQTGLHHVGHLRESQICQSVDKSENQIRSEESITKDDQHVQHETPTFF